jgi:mRNA-degrading endonuclease RelE of RelBE toxin-antitoxin system
MSKAPIDIRFSRRFLKDLKSLHKRYDSLRDDVNSLVQSLKDGNTPGDRLRLLKGYIIYKVRLRISSSTKGKSGGYRVIYWPKTRTSVILLTIYVKADRSDISSNEVKRILDDYIRQDQDNDNSDQES